MTPTELLGLQMELEADLGIDSIKRVEILSAVREKAPHLPEVDAQQMAALTSVQLPAIGSAQFGAMETADLVILGTAAIRGLATDQLAALGTIVSYGISVAAASMVSRAWGRGDKDEARRIAWQSGLLVLVLGAVLALLGGVFARPLLTGLIGVKGAVAERGADYLQVVMGGGVTMFLMLHCASLLRAVGSAKTPVFLLLLGNVWRNEKEYAKAVDAYDRMMARVPKLEERHWNLLYARGIANERAKNWPPPVSKR